MKNSEVEIGVANLTYEQDGSFKTAEFKPTMSVSMDAKAMDVFKKVNCQENEDRFIEESSAVFSTWFQGMNDIELHDMEKYQIATEFITPCEKYDNGLIKSCSIKFVYKRR